MKRQLSFEIIYRKISRLKLGKFDAIVAISNDGIIPAALLQRKLKIPMYIVGLSYRDENNCPMYKEPKLLGKPPKFKGKKLLVADLVSRSGRTLQKAAEIFKGNRIKTFVINGKADYSLFNYKECIDWPW